MYLIEATDVDMKVLHISRRFYPHYGGTERHIAEVATRLVAHGIDSRVLTLDRDLATKDPHLPHHGFYKNVEIFRLPALGHYKKPLPIYVPLSLFRWADVVHVHDVRVFYETALALKLLYGYALVLSTHGFVLHTRDLQRLKAALIRAYYVPTFRHLLDAIICVSEQDRTLFAGLELPNLHLVTNGVDVRRYATVPRHVDRGALLYFGRIDINKRIDYLFDALARVRHHEWHLDIIGTGPEPLFDGLVARAKALGIAQRLKWHGTVPEKDVLRFLARAHACLFPSSYEGFGLTLLEAMAASCIVVASPIQAYSDIVIPGQNGYLTEFGCPAKAAATIEELLAADGSKLAAMGAAARHTAKFFDWSPRVALIADIYRRIA